MSRCYNFRTLDVFTDIAYAGNQLGVVTVPQSQPLTQAEKQSIAVEFNYSESIFVHEPDDGTDETPPHVTVDIFTTESELPFAGHPTIGAINHILTHVHPTLSTVIVDLKAGPVVGTLDRTTGYASAEIPQEFHTHATRMSWDRHVLACQPGLQTSGDADVMNGSHHALVSIVRGLNFALVDLSAGGKELLRRVKVTPGGVAGPEDLDDGWPGTVVGTLFYAMKPDQGDGVVRIDQRVIVLGLEDPATGSASTALTAHLALKMGGKSAVHKFELIQGEQMGRRSVIGVEVTLDESGTRVKKVLLMGQCKAVMKGELEI